MENKRLSASLKLHRETVEETTPLTHIREKELELNTQILAAKKKAEQIVAQARREVVILKEQAVREGLKEGKAHFAARIAAAKKEAKNIRVSVASAESKKISQQGLKNLKKATQRILEAVLPSS